MNVVGLLNYHYRNNSAVCDNLSKKRWRRYIKAISENIVIAMVVNGFMVLPYVFNGYQYFFFAAY